MGLLVTNQNALQIEMSVMLMFDVSLQGFTVTPVARVFTATLQDFKVCSEPADPATATVTSTSTWQGAATAPPGNA